MAGEGELEGDCTPVAPMTSPITGLLDRWEFYNEDADWRVSYALPMGHTKSYYWLAPFGQTVIQWTNECNCVITDDQDIYCLSI